MYKAGDKVKVVRVAESFEGHGYEVGDVFEIVDVCTAENRIYEPEEGAILTTSTGIELYEKEVELYIEEAPKDYEEPSLYDELIETLSQASEGKTYSVTVDGEEVARLTDTISSSTEKIEAPKLWWGEGAHGIYTPGLRSPDKDSIIFARDEWEGMADVGKEVIYDDYNTDSVEHPAHYTQGGIEVIEIIAQTVSGYDDGFTAHCVGTATKYLNRAPHKHETPLEDLKKAAKYLEFAIKHEEKKRI